MRGPIVKHEQAVENMIAERYVLGELHGSERDEFEEHFFSCPSCAQDVRDLSTMTGAARDLLHQPRQAAMQRAAARESGSWRHWFRLSPALAWGSALAAMTVAALTATYQVVQLRGVVRPQAVASIVLPPETRGAAKPISAQRIGAFILLETDLPGWTGDLVWDLRPTGAQKAIDSQASAPPARGTSFKLLVPAAMLAPGEYTLAISSTTSPSGSARLFKFKLNPNGS